MKLGIIVVYMVNEQDTALLDIHLRMIARHTKASYTIYAGVNRLPPGLINKLAADPRVRLCHCPGTSQRQAKEHAFYLEHLVRQAVDDGVSHIAVMHVDSFPVTYGWDERLTRAIRESCVLVTLERSGILSRYTACLFFEREFYQRYRPSFLLGEVDRHSPVYQRYRREVLHHRDESGAGYCFAAYRAGLSWLALPRTAGMDDTIRGDLHGDLLFHLDGGFRRNAKKRDVSKAVNERGRNSLGAIISLLCPRRLRGLYHHFVIRPALEEQKRAFLNDPELYLARLRSSAESD